MLSLRPVRFALALGIAMVSGAVQAGTVGYDFGLTTHYGFGVTSLPSDIFSSGGTPGPDTGTLTIVNNGTTSFTGTLTLYGASNSGYGVNVVYTGTLDVGQSAQFIAGSESSNQGGFNGTNGLEFLISGNVTDGVTTEAVSLSVYDKDIHSGVFATNPFGVTLDNYVLEGGDATRDTSDNFETNQANGHYTFSEAAPITSTPEPATMISAVLGGIAVVVLRRRSR